MCNGIVLDSSQESVHPEPTASSVFIRNRVNVGLRLASVVSALHGKNWGACLKKIALFQVQTCSTLIVLFRSRANPFSLQKWLKRFSVRLQMERTRNWLWQHTYQYDLSRLWLTLYAYCAHAFAWTHMAWRMWGALSSALFCHPTWFCGIVFQLFLCSSKYGAGTVGRAWGLR